METDSNSRIQEIESQLDDHTISNAGSFLRDYIKKDYLLYIFKTKDNETNKDEEQE